MATTEKGAKQTAEEAAKTASENGAHDQAAEQVADLGIEVSDSPFSLELSQDQQDIRDWVHGFAEQTVRPAAHEWDEKEEFPWPVVQEAADARVGPGVLRHSRRRQGGCVLRLRARCRV
jgi:hypothetical protein